MTQLVSYPQPVRPHRAPGAALEDPDDCFGAPGVRETDAATGPERGAVRPLRVVVVGQGYVGLPLAVHAAMAGHHVVGFDNDAEKVAALAAGRSPIEDVSTDQLGPLLRAGRYRPSARPQDLAGFDVALIAVPTPLADGAPDLSFVRAAGEVVGKQMREGALVVLESTSYPGTTGILGDALETASGLQRGTGFGLGFSPERIDPGNQRWTVATTPKIISGIDGPSLARVRDFYSGLVDQVVPVDRCEEAELAKLIENTFRAVNIALVNELAELSREAGLEFRQAIAAASTKPFGFMPFDPGPGIGGHCLPVDPIYLSWWASRTCGRGSRLIDLAAQINDSRPSQVVARVEQGLLARGLAALTGARILLLGLAYKPGSGDVRESPAVQVARLLASRGAHVIACDPFVTAESVSDVPLAAEVGPELTAADAVVLLTDHHSFDYEQVAAESAFVLDCRGRMAGYAASTVEQL